MGKDGKNRSHSRDRSPSRQYYSGDEGKHSEKKKDKKKHGDKGSGDEHKKHEKKGKSREKESYGGSDPSYERPVSKEHPRGFPGEQGGYGMHQESHGFGERPNMQVYGHPGYGGQSGYGSQPQTYHPPPPSNAYGSGQGVYAYQSTSPPPVQYQPPGYQTGSYGGGGSVYNKPYQTGPSPPPPPGNYGAYQGYPPQSGPPGPPPQGYGYHPQEQPGYEYRPQEQPAAYGGYSPPVQQGPYAQGYQAPPGPPYGTPGYHSPPPNPIYSAPQHSTPAAYGAAVGAAAGAYGYNPQHHPAQQQQGASGQYGSTSPYAANPLASASAVPVASDPTNPGAKPAASGSALNTFTTGLNSALHNYARTLFPVAGAQKPTAGLGAPGDSGAPSQKTENRFDSFAPIHGGNCAKWYVDGKDYMYAVSVALEMAEKSIWILDWWLSPELYLRRPPALNTEYRLDRMLKRAAARGVKVNIIVYKEVTQALTLNSSHTKHWLEDLDKNIAVFRHPDHLPDRPTIQQDIFNKFTTGNYTIGDGLKGLYGMSDGVVLYWAHHEKLCLVDGEIAFMGGLDLCFGRWDMNHHPISDVHPRDLREIAFPGQDYNNARLMDFHSVEQWNQNKVLRTENSRMGWSDVALSLMGPVVEDLQRHFVARWNFIYRSKYEVRKDPRFSLLDESILGGRSHHGHNLKEGVKNVGKAFMEGAHSQGRLYGQPEVHGYDATGRYDQRAGVQCQIVRSASKWSHGLSATEHSIAHAYIEIILAAKYFVYIENQFFITATDDKQSPIMNKIGLAIVQRIIRAAEKGEKFRIIVVMPAIPAFAGDLQAEGSLGTRAIMEFQYRSICNDRGFSIMEQIRKAGYEPMQYIRFYNLRSYDRINVSRTMEQVQQESGVNYDVAAAALDGKVGGGGGQGTSGYGNPQPDAFHRYQQHAPGGGGEWDSVAKCSMLHGGDIRSVPWEGDPSKEMDAFVSEELYIHSKLLIADDQIVICGSANLNDRSQLGDHDSEIAVIISEDPPSLLSYMNGQEYYASHFAATLRRQIFRKHLGLIPAQTLGPVDNNMKPVPIPNIYDFGSEWDHCVTDPLSDRFWNLWNSTAKTNTDAFGRAFHVVPHDSVTNWKLYDEWFTKYFVLTKEQKLKAEVMEKEKDALSGDKKKPEEKPKPKVEWGHVVRDNFPGGVRELKELLSRIKGNLVEMPLNFLIEEDIAKEGIGLNALTETIYT